MTEQELHKMLKRGEARIAPVSAAKSEKVSTTGYKGKARPAKRQAPKNSNEHKEQVKLIQWKDENLHLYPRLAALYAVPNEGQRNPVAGRKKKAEGLLAGVLDLHLPCPVGEYCGLWIEMKYGRNKMTQSQREWADLMRWLGHRVEVCYWFEEARWVLLDYITESGTNLRLAA